MLVYPNHGGHQRIVSKTSRDALLKVYELCAEACCAVDEPFLALYTLQALAEEEEWHFPEAAIVLFRDMFVDCLIGANSLLKAQILQSQLIQVIE